MHKYLYLILALLFSCQLFSEMVSGKVISVKDGDTIEILYQNQALRIRLYGVDAPEKDQDFGQKAKMFTSQLAFSKIVKADIKNKDMYGRSVAEVFLPNGKSLNKELVKNGFAWHYKEYSKDEDLANLEIEAQNKKAGLWSSKNPQAPWEFRKEKKSGIKTPNRPEMKINKLKGGMFVASSNSKKYHRSSCKFSKEIPAQNKIYFNSSNEAKKQGYEPCKVCKP